MVTLSQQECKSLSVKAFTKAGMNEQDAKICTEHLIYNELSGKTSHGLVRVKWCINSIKKRGNATGIPKIEIDNQSVSIINGENNIGLIPVSYGTDIAIKRARKHGIALTGIKNYHGTTGSMNYYNRRILEAGLIGIIGCNSQALVTHPDAFDPVIGTNPISFAIPSKAKNFLTDVTTANMAYGKIMVIKREGKKLPEGMIIDADGSPSQNPDDAMAGAMLPMSGYKGFGLGLAVELLAGPLIGAKGGRNAVQGSDGLFIISIDPSKCGSQTDIERNMEHVLQEIKNSRHAPDIKDILIPGERSKQQYQIQKDKENINIIDEVYQELKELA